MLTLKRAQIASQIQCNQDWKQKYEELEFDHKLTENEVIAKYNAELNKVLCLLRSEREQNEEQITQLKQKHKLEVAKLTEENRQLKEIACARSDTDHKRDELATTTQQLCEKIDLLQSLILQKDCEEKAAAEKIKHEQDKSACLALALQKE